MSRIHSPRPGAVVASYEIVLTELIDGVTELMSRDDGWFRRLHAAAPAGTGALDAVFTDAEGVLSELWRRIQQLLTT